MSLTKQAVIDQITVTENGIVLYREATRIMEDGNCINIQLNSPQRLKTTSIKPVPASRQFLKWLHLLNVKSTS